MTFINSKTNLETDEQKHIIIIPGKAGDFAYAGKALKHQKQLRRRIDGLALAACRP